MRRVTLNIGGEVQLELMPGEIREDRVVEKFMRSGCGCVKREGRMCSGQFDVDYIKNVRLSFRALSNSEMDMAIMGQLMAFSPTDKTTSSFNRNTSHERRRVYTTHYHQGKSVCSWMFQFLHGISKKKLYNITTSLSKNGLTPRVHGNTKRMPMDGNG